MGRILMKLEMVFQKGSPEIFDGLDTDEWPVRYLAELTSFTFRGMCVHLEEGEIAVAHRLRRHMTVNPSSLTSYYVLFTSRRKFFLFENGTMVVMPEGGETDAWWRTFQPLSQSALAGNGL
jgi:hypothetical protein